MLCPKCGTDVGDQLTLCERCEAERAAEEKEAPPEAESPSEKQVEKIPGSSLSLDTGYDLESPFAKFLTNPLRFLWVVVALTPLFFLYVFFTTDYDFITSFLIVLVLIALGVAMVGHLLLLMSIFMNDVIIGILALGLPFLVYAFIISNLEEVRKPLAINIAGYVVAWALSMAIVGYSGMSFWEVSKIFSHLIRF